MSRLVLSLMLVAVLAGGAFANIPDAGLSDVPPVLIVPNNPNSGITVDCPGPPVGAVQYGPNNLGWTVNVQGNLGPVVGAVVEVAFSQAAWDRIAKCDGDAPECAFPTGRPAFCDMTGPADYIHGRHERRRRRHLLHLGWWLHPRRRGEPVHVRSPRERHSSGDGHQDLLAGCR
jgi:hypothetical protein